MTRHLHFYVALGLLFFSHLYAHSAFAHYLPEGKFLPVLSPTNTTAASIAPCAEINNEGFENSFGTWIDGGSNCARTNSFPNTGSWSVELRAGVGLTSSMYTPALNWSGMGIQLSFSIMPQGYENGEGIVLEYATDVSGTFTGYTAWVRGTHFENNTRYNFTVNMNNVQWTSNSRLRLRSVASATDDRAYIDDVTISNCCEIGAPCNDNDQCTTGDVVQANCQCAGTYQDADADGTCDAFDVCPGLDDYQVTSEFPCDDGDPCTEGDHLDVDICGCEGYFVDWDHDGYCHNEDPDDADACNPDPLNPACNPCVIIDNSHYESNFQIWNSGGNDCSRIYAPQYASAGNYCVRIRDNGGSVSSMFTNNLNLAGANHISISFSYIALSMEANEDFFLDVSTNGGASYTPSKSWKRGIDFENNARKFEFVEVSGFTWTSQTRFRFRCDASANDDAVYIDDVIIKSCENYAALQQPDISLSPAISNAVPTGILADDILLTPNPVRDEIQISGIDLKGANIALINISGHPIRTSMDNRNMLDVSQLIPGLYYLHIVKNGAVIVKRFIKE